MKVQPLKSLCCGTWLGILEDSYFIAANPVQMLVSLPELANAVTRV
jgi:hypothetical protein